MAELNVLLEMGFSKEKVERALSVTGHQGVEAAMEWLLAYSEAPEIDNLPKPKEENNTVQSTEEKEASLENSDKPENVEVPDIESEEGPVQPKSIQCNECSKKFRTEAEVEFHAVKTGHQDFAESTEEIIPLTEEEKREQLRLVEEKIKQRRAEREEHERKDAVDREKQRRKVGQEMTSARQRLEEMEMKLIAQQRRQEKLDAKMARQRVLEEIERDKQARREKFGTGGNAGASAPLKIPEPAVLPQSSISRDYEECKLQIRLSNGHVLAQTFSPNEELAAVRLYVEMNRTDGCEPFSLMTNFPRKVFTEDDMGKPLKGLGLVPSAVLILTKCN